jgi:ribonuclease VapC
MTIVLDASALLGFLQDEPGGDQVEAVLSEAVISSVNWAEVVQKSVAADVLINGMREDLEALGMKILPFAAEEAEIAGQLWLQTRQAGLSLGDRACLSLGIRLQAPVLTADQIWITLKLSVTVHSIRSPI